MITLYDHIQELRAELRGCCFTRRERTAVEAELANAIAEQAELGRAFDAALVALSKSRQADWRRRVSGPSPLPPRSASYIDGTLLVLYRETFGNAEALRIADAVIRPLSGWAISKASVA